ncbi:MAG: sulfite exporter TauE/SafE family protein [Luminiphilus sp.]|jgi:uncharacterized protein|nr:sulfite exporter TauE/SafE family protein [Luminiphilus sp.]
MVELVGLFFAGLVGGIINSVAGGGSFITFPALIAAGVPPIAANATNTFASCAGYLSGAAGFRSELWAHRAHLPRVFCCALLGGGMGAWLLLQTPEEAFSRAVPWLLLLATALLIWGETLQAVLYRHLGYRQGLPVAARLILALLLLAVCTYGGFFNAGFGIILLGYLTLAGYQDIHLMNGLKLLVSALVAALAIIIFSAADIIAWRQGSAVLMGTLLGGYAAASVVRVVRQSIVRRCIITVAAGMTAYFFVTS